MKASDLKTGILDRIDSAIEVISPRWARRRAADRLALGMLRGYEGASRGRRTNGWKTGATGANAEVKLGIVPLRNRARDLVRNNPYAARAVSVIASNVVGYGIMTTPAGTGKTATKKLREAHKAWAESTQCDAAGMDNLFGLQRLAMRTIVEAGEVIIRRRWVKASEKLAVPIQISVLEPDYIDSSKDGIVDGNVAIMGVEFDKQGKRIAYWLFDQHPGDGGGTPKSSRVPAADVIHVYRCDRPGQVRGVSWFSPVIIRLRDFDEHEDAQLVRQKIAACFAGFVTDADGEAKGSAALTEKIEPGALEILPPGKSIVFPNTPQVTGYSEFASVTLHAIAVGVGIPYESLTGDYSQVNFTSGRMGRIEFFNNLDVWQWNMMIPQMCDGVFEWFRQAALIAGLPAEGATAKHTPPRRQLTDPTREIPATIKAIRGGLQTQFSALREAGEDPEAVMQEIAAANALLDKLGIVIDTDPRKVSGAGLTQARPDGTVIPSTEIGGGEDGEAQE